MGSGAQIRTVEIKNKHADLKCKLAYQKVVREMK